MSKSKTNYFYDFPINKNHTRAIHRCRFKLSDLKKDERMTIFGLTGTGKSHLAKKILEYHARTRLVVVLDTKCEKLYNKIPELPIEKLLDKKSKGLYRVRNLAFSTQKITNPTIICEFLASNLFKRGNCLFMVEEMPELIPKSGVLIQVMPKLGKYITQGRAFNCSFIGTSQRPAETHTSIPSQSNHVISFYMSLEHDIKYLKKWFPETIYQKFLKRKEDKISHEFVRFYVNHQETYHHYRYYPRTSKKTDLNQGEKVSRTTSPDKT